MEKFKQLINKKNVYVFGGAFAVVVLVLVSIIFMSGNEVAPAVSKVNKVTGNLNVSDGRDKSSEPTPSPVPKIKKEVKAKGLYLTGWTVSNDAKVDHFINLAKTTEINAYVVDIKDDDGKVGYKTEVALAHEVGGWQKKYDVDKVLKKFKDNDIYVIGRIVCFKDPILSSKETERAIKAKSGGVWRDRNGKTWLNPYHEDNWKYAVEIAKEAVAKGFDEIQFDYIRFANDGAKANMDFSQYSKQRYEIINDFISYARKELPEVKLSADVFGIICESPADTEEIGQYLELIGKELDYISPMVYPSHYAVGQKINGVQFMKPDLEPYGVVNNTLVKAKNRLTVVKDYKAKVRPFLQDFTASWLGSGYYQKYGPDQVRQQIKAVYDAGYDEWLLWNANNRYSESAFEKE